MGRFDPTYTDDQRQAVAEAINNRGVPAPEVIRLAAAGDLAEGLSPFEIPATSVRDIAAAEKKRRPAGRPDVARLNKVVDSTLTMVESEMDELQAKQKTKGHFENPDMTRLAKLVRVARATRDLALALPTGDEDHPAQTATTTTTSSPDLIERMHAQLAREKEVLDATECTTRPRSYATTVDHENDD